jgi:hypothetical protein
MTTEPTTAPKGRPKTIVGALEREEDGYCYVRGVPQALRRGWDIEASAQVGDAIACNYVQRPYGYGWYGTVVRMTKE